VAVEAIANELLHPPSIERHALRLGTGIDVQDFSAREFKERAEAVDLVPNRVGEISFVGFFIRANADDQIPESLAGRLSRPSLDQLPFEEAHGVQVAEDQLGVVHTTTFYRSADTVGRTRCRAVIVALIHTSVVMPKRVGSASARRWVRLDYYAAPARGVCVRFVDRIGADQRLQGGRAKDVGRLAARVPSTPPVRCDDERGPGEEQRAGDQPRLARQS
jgi:hypothetical protein